MRFNPFDKISDARGSPMGRRSNPSALDPNRKLCAQHQQGDGYYDRGGAYWGTSSEGSVWAVWEYGNGPDTVVYVRAHNREKAIEKALNH